MAQIQNNSNPDDLERLLLQGIHLDQQTLSPAPPPPAPIPTPVQTLKDDDDAEVPMDSDLQGAIALFAEAAQDMATAGLELSLGRHFACVDYCNQVAEKSAQAVSLLRFGRRSMYDHDLRALGAVVDAPQPIQDEMASLTPFHPETFYIDTPPEEADAVISAEQANQYLQRARHVLHWARSIVLQA